MSTEQNKRNIRRFVDEAFNGRQFDVIDELYRPDAHDHNMLPGLPQGPAGSKMQLGVIPAPQPA